MYLAAQIAFRLPFIPAQSNIRKCNIYGFIRACFAFIGKLIATWLVASVTGTSQRCREYVSNRVPFMRIYGLLSYAPNMNYSYSRKLLISVILTVVFMCCPVTATATCYLPNGSTANGDILCSGSLPSQCCPCGSICLSNGLCFNTDSLLSRSSFTRSTWN